MRGIAAIACAALVGAVALASAGSARSHTAPPAELRVLVIAVDSLDPDEVDARTPALAELKASGTWYTNSLAVLPSSTAPNFAVMATGAVPARNGIVSNTYRAPGGAIEQMQSPDLWQADHFVTRLERDCSTRVDTATFFGWRPLYELFRSGGGQIEADLNWAPGPLVPVADSALDPPVMNEILAWLASRDPSVPAVAFSELVDVDNAGHVDPTGAPTGGAFPAFRALAITETDAQLRRLVDALKRNDHGRRAWDSTVLIITSDHSMDRSPPDGVIRVSESLAAAGFVEGEDFQLAPNGGFELIYATDEGDVPAMLAAIRATSGVDFALTRDSSPSLADYGLDDPRSGDIVAFAEQGRRFLEADQEHFIPGQHGHPPTQPSTMLVTGGHPSLAGPQVAGGAATTGLPPSGTGSLSIAPTVTRLFGLDVPAGEYDGAPLTEAFAPGALAGSYCG